MLAVHQGDVFWALARESFVPMSSVSVRADAFRACGGFVEDRQLSGTADWELWLRMAARWPVGFVDQVATCIRVHASSMLADPSYMEPAMLAGVRHALADQVVAQRAPVAKVFFARVWTSHWRCTRIAIGSARAACAGSLMLVAAWPPVALDTRFIGALVRAVVGPTIIRSLAR